MREPVVALMVAAAISLPSSAFAAQFKAAPNMTFDMEPIAPEGSFSTWTVTDLHGLNAVHTRAAFLWFGRDPKWAPGFKVMLESRKEEVMLAIGGQEGRAMQISLETWQKQKLIDVQNFKLAPDSADEIELQVSWDDKTMTASVSREGGREIEQHTAKLDAPPKDLSIAVSTATVRFVPLQLGTVTP